MEDRQHGNRRRAWLLVGVYLALYAVVLCLVAFRGHQIGHFAHETDFYWKHVPNARDVLAGTFPNYGNKMPFYSLVLAVVYLVAGDWFTAGRLISIMASVGVLVVMARIVLRLTRGRSLIALLAVMLVSSNSTFFSMSYEVGRDVVLMLLCAGALDCMLCARGRRGLLAAALLAALATLTRLNGLVLMGALVVRAGFMSAWRARRMAGLLWLPFLLYGALFGAWPALKYLGTGSAALMLKKSVRYAAGGQATFDGPQARGALALAGRVLNVFLGRLPTHLTRDAFQLLRWPVAGLTALGLVAGGFQWRAVERRRDVLVLAAFVLGSVLMLSLFHYESRYSLPHVFWLPLIALAILTTPAVLRLKSLFRWTAVVWIGIGLFAGNVHRTVDSVRWRLSIEPRYLLAFADYLNAHASDGELVINFKPHISVLTGLPWRRLSRREMTTPGRFIAGAREAGATYILFAEKEATAYAACSAMVTPTNDFAGVIPVFHTPHGVLYRLAPTNPPARAR